MNPVTERVRKFRREHPEKNRAYEQRRRKAWAEMRRRYPNEYLEYVAAARNAGRDRKGARDWARSMINRGHHDEWKQVLAEAKP